MQKKVTGFEKRKEMEIVVKIKKKPRGKNCSVNGKLNKKQVKMWECEAVGEIS